MRNSNQKSNEKESEGPSHCGSKPKTIAIGIAPLGFISIGIVPMGIVTIGVVPMGVVSLGIVAMGVINASIVGMGIFSAGITTMGLKVWSPDESTLVQIQAPFNEAIKQTENLLQLDINGDQSIGEERKNINQTNNETQMILYPSRSQAEEAAKKIGCLGIHKMGDFWMPCASHSNN